MIAPSAFTIGCAYVLEASFALAYGPDLRWTAGGLTRPRGVFDRVASEEGRLRVVRQLNRALSTG